MMERPSPIQSGNASARYQAPCPRATIMEEDDLEESEGSLRHMLKSQVKYSVICLVFIHFYLPIQGYKDPFKRISLSWLSLTLLTSISVLSKCLPYIFGASPPTCSILMHTSWPLRAVSTFLWFNSRLLMHPISSFYIKIKM